MSTWKFSIPQNEQRQQALSSAPTFEFIAAQIESEMRILCCDPDSITNSPFARVVYCLQVSNSLFDLFFNSQNGYRGEYYKSPYRGLEANAYFIQSMRIRLLDWTRRNAICEASFAEESITTPSAKVWLAECERNLCDKCKGEWKSPQNDEPEILNGRWEHAYEPNARYGKMAPTGTKLRIIGAFLNCKQDEFVPATKRHRALEIHQCGWS